MNGELPNSKAWVLAEHLLAYEGQVRGSSEENMNKPAVVSVSEKLQHRLSTLAGSSGYRVLLVRALNLAKTDTPSLGPVRVNPDGSLGGGLVEEQTAMAAGAALISHLLGLLFSFIGEDLTVRIVLDLWPELANFIADLRIESEHGSPK